MLKLKKERAVLFLVSQGWHPLPLWPLLADGALPPLVPRYAYARARAREGSGFVAGTHIVFIDFNHKVEIQSAGSTTIRIHNGNTGTEAGNVTLVW